MSLHSEHPRNRTTLTKQSRHYFPQRPPPNVWPSKIKLSLRKYYQDLLSGQGILSNIKDCHKMCGHPKFFEVLQNVIKSFQSIISHPKKCHKLWPSKIIKVPEIFIKTNKVFRALLSTQKTDTKCVITAAGQTYHPNKNNNGLLLAGLSCRSQ